MKWLCSISGSYKKTNLFERRECEPQMSISTPKWYNVALGMIFTRLLQRISGVINPMGT